MARWAKGGDGVNELEPPIACRNRSRSSAETPAVLSLLARDGDFPADRVFLLTLYQYQCRSSSAKNFYVGVDQCRVHGQL
jgi:hypothetical protein